jgi:hypothetical protein
MARLGVGVVGFGWMGGVHAQAYAGMLHHPPRAPHGLTPADAVALDAITRSVQTGAWVAP